MLLELRNVSAGYGSNAVIRDVNIHIEAGEIITLIGANGAGKSTIVKNISGLMRPMSGQVFLEGSQIQGLSAADRLSLGIAHVPEGRQIFAGMTVAENLRLGTYGKRDGAWTDRASYVFQLFPVLKERINDTAGNFSGGQQQMLAIARGLMSKPRILMLDEPSLGLSPILVNEIFKLIKRLRDEGLTILLVEQNARSALQIADRGYVIENGKVVLSGGATDLLQSAEVAESYLGRGKTHDSETGKAALIAERLRACFELSV